MRSHHLVLLAAAVQALLALVQCLPVKEHAHNSSNSASLGRRWASIEGPENSGQAKSKHGLWPAREGLGTPIYYCFINPAVAEAVFPYFGYGIALWQPAEKYSSIKIMPDPACYDRDTRTWTWKCVCSSGTMDDTVVILDGKITQEDGSRVMFQDVDRSSLGYDHTSQERGRHRLVLPSVYTLGEANKDSDVQATLAHESGHVMGLIHEHQRPDRGRYLGYQPQYLDGYEQMLRAVQDPGKITKFPVRYRGSNARARRQELASTQFVYAKDFFPAAVEYVDARTMPYGVAVAYDEGAFDYGSIMIYSSSIGVPKDKKPVSGEWPIVRQNTRPKSIPVWMGGHPTEGRVSIRDVQRIAMLYPSEDAEKRAEVARLPNWPAMTVDVHVADKAGLETTAQWRLSPNPPQVVDSELQPLFNGPVPGAIAPPNTPEAASQAEYSDAEHSRDPAESRIRKETQGSAVTDTDEPVVQGTATVPSQEQSQTQPDAAESEADQADDVANGATRKGKLSQLWSKGKKKLPFLSKPDRSSRGGVSRRDAGSSEHKLQRRVSKEHGLWPSIEGLGTPIRYCFMDQAAADIIYPFLPHAIALWGPAKHYSSLSILPDLACYTGGLPNNGKWDTDKWHWKCVCGKQQNGRTTAADSLLVTDGRATAELGWRKWIGTTQAYPGYDYRIDSTARHYLSFALVHDLPDVEHRSEYLSVQLAHELGHVMGLPHEHQRPDRLHYLEYRPQYLEGYPEMLAKIRDPKNARDFPGNVSTEDEKIEPASNDFYYATQFFKSAKDYVDQRTGPYHDMLVYDPDVFDFGSIMIYDSTSAMSAEITEAGFEAGECPIMRKLPGGKLEHIYQAGHKIDGRISVIDVQRIAKLYPHDNPAVRTAAAELKQWPTMEVAVPGSSQMWTMEPNSVQAVNYELMPLYGEGYSESSMRPVIPMRIKGQGGTATGADEAITHGAFAGQDQHETQVETAATSATRKGKLSQLLDKGKKKLPYKGRPSNGSRGRDGRGGSSGQAA